MLTELFKAISQQAVSAFGPQVQKYDPDLDLVFRDSAGVVVFRPGDPKRRTHLVYSIDDVAQFAKDHADPAGMPAAIGTGSCFYSRAKIVYFPQDSVRKDAAIVELVFSQQMKELIKRQSENNRMDQKQLLWLLRTTFKNNISQSPGLIEAIKNVKWDQNSVKTAEVGRGKASIGTNIQKNFAGLLEIPEYVIFNVPVWDGAIRFDVNVNCILEPDEQNGNFCLMPLPGEIEIALTLADAELGRRLSISLGEGFFLYNGTP